MADAATTYMVRISKPGIQPIAPVDSAATFKVGVLSSSTFADTSVGSAAVSDIVVPLTNVGAMPGSFKLPTLSGQHPADFSATTDCTNVAKGESCTIAVRFIPTAAGVRTASLQLGSGPAVTFTGTGLPPAPAPSSGSVSLLLHLDDATNRVTDSSPAARAISMASGVGMVSAPSVTGGRSLYFDGSANAYVTTAADSAFNFGTGDFTVEGWVYFLGFNGVASGVFQQSSGRLFGNGNPSNSVALGTIDSRAWQVYAANGQQVINVAPALKTWTHFAVVRAKGTTKFYLNGVSKMSVADPVDYTGELLGVGGIWSSAYSLNGYLDEFRVTKGFARYTADFTPVTSSLAAR